MTNLADPFSFAKTAIGFDSILKRMQEANDYFPKMPTYPPFNVKKVDEGHYVIELAVAGFGKQDLDIELKEDTLTITGKTQSEDADYIHKGIADRAFTRKFTVADSVVVKNAELVNGMLKVYLEHFIPEEKKAKKIDILDPLGVGESTKQLLTEGAKSWNEGVQKATEMFWNKDTK
jgi:molecular chaperone IbpA